MPSVRRFSNQEDCRKAIAAYLRSLERDDIKPDKARVLIYGALSISGILADRDVEHRLETLEAVIPKLRRTA